MWKRLHVLVRLVGSGIGYCGCKYCLSFLACWQGIQSVYCRQFHCLFFTGIFWSLHIWSFSIIKRQNKRIPYYTSSGCFRFPQKVYCLLRRGKMVFVVWEFNRRHQVWFSFFVSSNCYKQLKANQCEREGLVVEIGKCKSI